MSNLGKNDPRCDGVGCSIRGECSRQIHKEEPAVRRHKAMFTKGFKCFAFIKEEKQKKEKVTWE